MTFSEILPTVRSLPRADKLRLIRILSEDVASDEGIGIEMEEKTVPIWSPYDSFEAAATLLRLLDEAKAEA